MYKKFNIEENFFIKKKFFKISDGRKFFQLKKV